MTVPTLMQNHQRKAYVTQLHKVYNIVQQASVQYLTDRNAVNLREAGLNSEDKIAELIKLHVLQQQQIIKKYPVLQLQNGIQKDILY